MNRQSSDRADAALLLGATRELLTNPSNWTFHASARVQRTNLMTTPWDKDATCWCLTGALAVLAGPDHGHELPIARRALELSAEALFGDIVREWTNKGYHAAVTVNDYIGHEATLQILDHAISTFQESQQS